jgi:hypothetical protein
MILNIFKQFNDGVDHRASSYICGLEDAIVDAVFALIVAGAVRIVQHDLDVGRLAFLHKLEALVEGHAVHDDESSPMRPAVRRQGRDEALLHPRHHQVFGHATGFGASKHGVVAAVHRGPFGRQHLLPSFGLRPDVAGTLAP